MNSLYTNIKLMLQKHRMKLVCVGISLTLIILFLWPSMVISIRPGELGVLYSRFGGGTVLDRTYEEGLHVIQPWNILYIYDMRVQEETQSIDVLTVDGLTISVSVSVRYQIIRDRLPTLHQDIGPSFRTKIMIPITNSAVRQTIGNYRPDDLYSTARQELQDQMLVDAVEEMGRIPILIHGFVVKNITLPEVLRKAIEEKLVAEQNYLRYNYLLLEAKQEAKRKAIEGQGIQYYQMLVGKNMTSNYLRHEGIRATRDLAASPNAKIVVVGGKDGLPLILNTDSQSAPPTKGKAEPEDKPESHDQPQPAMPAPDAMKNRGNVQKPGADHDGKAMKDPTQDEGLLDILQRLDKTLLAPNTTPKTPKS